MAGSTDTTPPNSFYSARGVLAVAVALTAWRVGTLVVHPLNLSFDEAQYWFWAQHLDLGYFSKPPLIGWVIALTTGLCGEAEVCIKLGSPLAYMGAAVAVFLAGQALYGPKVGFWSAVAFATLPAVALSAMVISVDPLLLLFWALALWALVRALDGGGSVWWAAMGLAVGGGLLAKYAMVLFPLSLLLYLAWSPSRRHLLRSPAPWLALVVALLVAAPNLVWNAAHGFVTFAHTRDNAHLGGASLFHPAKMGEFLAAQAAVFGPLLFGVLAWIAATTRRVTASDERARLLLAFTLPLLAMMTVESFLSRANANWAAPAYVTGVILVTAWLDRRGKLWLVKVSVALHLVAAAGLYNFDALARAAGPELAAKFDPVKRVRGWDRVGMEVSRVWRANPGTRLLFDRRKVMAPLIYYVRPHPFDAVKWNEAGHIADHFDLTTDMNRHMDESFLLVTEEPNANHVAPTFDSAELLSVIRVPIHPRYAREIRVFRLDRFKGYRQ